MQHIHRVGGFTSFIEWTLVFSAGTFISLLILPHISLHAVLLLILAGVVMEFTSLVYQRLRYKNQIVLRKQFLLWILVYAFAFWLGNTLSPYIYANILVDVLTVGILSAIIARTIKHFDLSRHGRVLITSIVFLLALGGSFFFFPNAEGNYVTTQTDTNSPLTRIVNSVEGLIAKVSSLGCTQLKVPLEDVPYKAMEGFSKGIFYTNKSYDGWTINEWGVPLEISILNPDYVPCVKGNAENQRPDHWYCGRITRAGNLLTLGMDVTTPNYYMEQRMMNSDGTIGKTVKTVFSNEYDSEGNFVRTKCYFDPDKADAKAEQEFVDFLMQ